MKLTDKQKQDRMMDIDILYALHREPIESLEDILLSYKKEEMLNVGETMGAKVYKSYTKARLAHVIQERIQQQIEEILYDLSPFQLGYLKRLMKGPVEDYQIDVEAEQVLQLFTLFDLGFLFIFHADETYTLLMPEEVRRWIREAFEQPDFSKQMETSQEVRQYIIALLHLYGVYPLNQFVKVWNDHHPHDKMDALGIFVYALKMQPLLEKLAVDALNIYHSEVFDPEDAELFAQSSAHHSYYMPTKADIVYYSNHAYETRTSQYKRMHRYISNKLPPHQTKEVMDLLMLTIQADFRLQFFSDGLEDLGIVLFDGEKDLETFSELYMDLNNSARKWTTRGNVPQSLSRNEAEGVKSSRKQQPIRVEKIGRNDPCPCGSGKKYKHCHGR